LPVFALNIHAGFACRHSGACCTAGWPIPVDARVHARILADPGLSGDSFHTAGQMPDGAVAVLAPRTSGACPFFEPAAGNRCAVQRRLGHEGLPADCRHFPRVTLLEPDGVRVTLSHFCPTAALMLFRRDIGWLEIVTVAAGIADRREHEGFDARHTIPPFLRPGVATDERTRHVWERFLISALDTEGLTPEDALADVSRVADLIRAWTAGAAGLSDHTERIVDLGVDPARTGRWTMSGTAAARLFGMAAASVPDGLVRPRAPKALDEADRLWVAPVWASLARPLRRYLAARAFAAWCAYLGEGLRTQVAMVGVALAVARIEAARQAGAAARLLDEPLLHAAIRSADHLLQHLADQKILVDSLASVERASAHGFLDAVGLQEVA
jgi:hypothetical protein